MPEFVRNFSMFLTLNNSDESENSLARGSIVHLLNDSLQETRFNGCRYSNDSVLDIKYFLLSVEFPQKILALIWSGCKQNQQHFLGINLNE
jgi:hypothetical protein